MVLGLISLYIEIELLKKLVTNRVKYPYGTVAGQNGDKPKQRHTYNRNGDT